MIIEIKINGILYKCFRPFVNASLIKADHGVQLSDFPKSGFREVTFGVPGTVLSIQRGGGHLSGAS